MAGRGGRGAAGDGLSVVEGTGPGGGASTRALSLRERLVAFFVAIFHPIFLVLVSVISPAKDRDQQSQRAKTQSKHQPQQNTTTKNSNHDRSATEKQHLNDRHDISSIITLTSQDDDDDQDLIHNPAHSPKRMAPPPLQNQPSAANRSSSNANKGINTNGQPPAKVALPRNGPHQGVFKQENVSANGDAIKHPRSNDRDGANANQNGRKYRSVGEEQAEENRHDQLTLPPLALDTDTVEDSVVDEIDEEPEDPVTAAERAYHTGFMNQALDMVCLFVALIPHAPSGLLLSAMTHVPLPIPIPSHLMLFPIAPFKADVAPLFFDLHLSLLPPPVTFHSLVAAFHNRCFSLHNHPAPTSNLVPHSLLSNLASSSWPVHIGAAMPGYQHRVYHFPPLLPASEDPYADQLVYRPACH